MWDEGLHFLCNGTSIAAQKCLMITWDEYQKTLNSVDLVLED